MKIIVTLIPIDLVTKWFLFFRMRQKRKLIIQEGGGLVTQKISPFCLQRVALYLKGIPDSIMEFSKGIFLYVFKGFYKGMFLYVFPVCL